MKTQNNIILTVALFTTTLASGLVTLNADAAVRSISREKTVEVNGKRTTEVVVTCPSFSQTRVITREDNSSIWCNKNAPDNCYSGKLRAARKACFKSSSKQNEKNREEVSDDQSVNNNLSANEGPSASSINKEPSANKQPSVAAKEKLGPNGKTRAQLMREYIQIEEQRIVIEQQKIELNKRELQIQKRELAL